MPRKALWRALTFLAAVLPVVGCKDFASSGGLTLVVAPGTRSYGVNQDSVVVVADSAVVTLAGQGSATAAWTATHGGAGWLTLVTASGTGSGAVRWVRYPISLPPGTYVDTITIVAQGASGSPRAVLDSVTIRGTPAQFITVRRPWLPGERDATIAFIVRNRSLNILGIDLSDLAPQILSSDSTTVVVQNPLYQTTPLPGMQLVPKFSSGWGIIGFDLSQVNQSNTPYDSLNWLGVKWWNPADSTWVGMTVKATTATTYFLSNVVTSSFDASGGKSGAGGGEAQQSTGTYWEASSGQIAINTNGSCGTTTTIASGVYKGGTIRTCTFGGRLVNLTMPRLAGTTAPSTQTINFDFRTATISGARVTCIFPSPCTSMAAASVARLRAQGARLIRYTLTGQP